MTSPTADSDIAALKDDIAVLEDQLQRESAARVEAETEVARLRAELQRRTSGQAPDCLGSLASRAPTEGLRSDHGRWPTRRERR